MKIKPKGLKEILEDDKILAEKMMPEEAAKILAENEEDVLLEDACKIYQPVFEK